MNRAVPAGCFIDGAACVQLVRLLAPLVRGMPTSQLDELRPALAAIGQAADRERVAEAVRLRQEPRLDDGWMPVAEYARAKGVSPQSVRKRISHGTLAAERRGRCWVVDPTG